MSNKKANIVKVNPQQTVNVIVECPYCADEIYTHSRIAPKGLSDDAKEPFYRTISCDECESVFDIPPTFIEPHKNNS